MGKIAFCVAGLLVLLGSGSGAEAKTVRASKKELASQAMSKKAKWAKVPKAKKLPVRPTDFGRGGRRSLVTPPEPVDDLLLEGLSQFGTKFVSHRVRFAASEAPVPEEYNCDAAAEEQKKQEAEREALARCEASGKKHCRVHRSVIVKNGELKCRDVPGKSCRQKQYFRGCVAKALAVGGEPPTSAAGIF